MMEYKRVGKASKRHMVRDIVKLAKCNIVCFQEMKWEQVSPRLIASSCGARMDAWEVVNATVSSGGIITAWCSGGL